MDPYARRFIRASVIYLGVGALLGLHMAFADHGSQQIRFVHIHFLLLGFMAMMIYGVAYHILPRFNARPVAYPALITVHYWAANVGLWAMTGLFVLGAFWSDGALRMLFGLAGTVEVAAILIFVFNIYGVVRDEEEVSHAPAAAPAPEPEPEADTPKVKIDPGMKIAEILDQWPHLEEALNDLGFSNLTSPAVRQSAAKMVSLKMAATQAGKDLFDVIAALEGKSMVTTDDAPAEEPVDGFLPTGPQITRGDLAVAKTQIGNLLQVYPETKVVFAENYGEACFTCPGQKTESVEQTAMMHNMPTEKILGQINAIIEKTLN